MQQHTQSGRFGELGRLLIALWSSAALGCGSDDKPPAPADLANLNLGSTCTEYHGVDPAEVGGKHLPGTQPGKCQALTGNQLCAVCSGASVLGLDEIGLDSLDYYYYGVSDDHCRQLFGDARLADECVAIRRGMFDPRVEGLRGPNDVSAPELNAGTPNPELGEFAYSIRRLEVRGRDAIELTRCSNFYDETFEPGVDRVREPCPDEGRCMTCVSRGQNGAATFESIRYRSASDPDQCGKVLAAADPDGCAQANRGVLVIARD